MQACFASIPSDSAGRYVYFALRYPTPSIVRHIQGQPVTDGDRLVLRFIGKKEVRIVLTYQRVPWLKHADRLNGFHEITAYLPGEAGNPTKLLHAQAFEKINSDDHKNWVTILGRINSLLLPVEEDGADWPTAAVKALKIGVEVFTPTTDKLRSDQPLNGFSPGEQGTAKLSLEQAYRLAVPSKATLAVTVSDGKGRHSLHKARYLLVLAGCEILEKSNLLTSSASRKAVAS